MKELILNRVTCWDAACVLSIVRLHQLRSVSKILTVISHSGNGYLYPLIGFLILLFFPDHAPEFTVAGGTAYALELTLYKFLKNRIRRNRPCHTLSGINNGPAPIDQYSFPSGHTAAAFVMATLFYYFFPSLSGLVMLWACMVGFSRIHLGVHYTTDTLAGMVLGIASAITGIAIAI